MTAEADLHVEVQGVEIVVTLPGTNYAVTYYRTSAFPQQLLTKSHSGREDHGAPAATPGLSGDGPKRSPMGMVRRASDSDKGRPSLA
jgi:hypothetical protein